MAKFYFFSDPALLDSQVAAQAFGPAGASAGKDQFRVTDLHRRNVSSSADVPAFAICDGVICAQEANDGTLSLILKPTEQPPFDFPFISYIIYKGIDPASIIKNGVIDTSKAGVNKLVASIQKSWAANSNTGDPTRECLGLHLTPTSTAVDYPDLDLSKYANGEALDRLFYQGDGKFQLPLVRGGWPIGIFSSASFGLEIIVERIAYQPKIALARKLENVIEVDSLDPLITYASNDATYFMHWHAKEECLNFMDPCAFWGSFFATSLRVWDAGSADFGRKTGSGIYDVALFGATSGDQPGIDGNFCNRNRAYVDIRNEHGYSLNYYKADGDTIQATLDENADIDGSEINYYASGWPSFSVDGSPPVALPSGATGDRIDLRFALPRTDSSRPLVYVSVGYRNHFRRLKDAKRFLERARRADKPYLEEATITMPLVKSPAKIAASYHRLCHFKRALVVDGQPVPPTNSNSLAPVYVGPYDHIFPLLKTADLPTGNGSTVVKTYAEDILVNAGSDSSRFFVARPALAKDAETVLLLLVPAACAIRAQGSHKTSGTRSFSPLVVLPPSVSVFEFLRGRYVSSLSLLEIPDPTGEINEIDVLYLRTGSRPRTSPSADDLITLAVTLTELSTLQSLVSVNTPTYAVPTLSIQNFSSFSVDGRSFMNATLSVSTLVGHPIVSRWTQPFDATLYSHAAENF